MDPRWKKHVRDVFGADADALQRAHDAVRATVASPGWEVIQGMLRAERGIVDRKLDDPDRVLEHADYALKHGYRAGLNALEDVARVLIDYTAELVEDQRRRHEGVPGGSGSRREGS